MAANLDSVTAATRLRRETMEVQRELEEKRSEYQRRMERVREQEEVLKADRAKLQDTLVQYYKYIQDNELKRSRANKKAAAEEKSKQERFGQIKSLRTRMEDLEGEKNNSRSQYLQLVKYQKYLEDVLQHNDNDEYQDPKDIIKRFEILDDNTRVLQRRKTQLEEDLGKNKVQLLAKRARKKNESVDLQNQLSELQNRLESLQRSLKKQQDDLDSTVTHRGATTKTIGQVRMACQNLYDRCMEWNASYRSRAHRDAESTDVLHQLSVIGDCLGDYMFIIKKHNERARDAKQQQHQQQQLPPLQQAGAGGQQQQQITASGSGAAAVAGLAQTARAGGGTVGSGLNASAGRSSSAANNHNNNDGQGFRPMNSAPSRPPGQSPSARPGQR